MNREDFEDRFGSLEAEGFTPEECGIRRRRRRKTAAEQNAEEDAANVVVSTRCPNHGDVNCAVVNCPGPHFVTDRRFVR